MLPSDLPFRIESLCFLCRRNLHMKYCGYMNLQEDLTESLSLQVRRNQIKSTINITVVSVALVGSVLFKEKK